MAESVKETSRESVVKLLACGDENLKLETESLSQKFFENQI